MCFFMGTQVFVCLTHLKLTFDKNTPRKIQKHFWGILYYFTKKGILYNLVKNDFFNVHMPSTKTMQFFFRWKTKE